MFNTTKFTDKGNGFQLAASEGVTDTTLLGIATDYRTNVSRKYKTLPARLLEQSFDEVNQVFASVKYDGEAVFVFFDDKEDICTAFNAPSGRARIGLKCLKEFAAKLKKAGVKKGLFVSEIYLKGDKRSQVGDVIHVTFNGSPAQRDDLALAVYDIIMVNGKDLRANQGNFTENQKLLEQYFGTSDKEAVHQVEGRNMAGKEVKAYFEEVTGKRGLEGIVVRNLTTTDIFKIKPSITVDAVVVGFVEGDFEGQYGVTSLLCALYDKDSRTTQILTRVGSGFSDEQRTQMLEPLNKLKVANPLDMTDSDGRPINFVKPQIVIEVEGEGLVRENFHGKVNTSQTFIWDGKTFKFKGLGASPLLTHATFARFRQDKTWDDGGCRLEQIMSTSDIKALAQEESLKAGPPEIILREAYTKTAKGEVAVRKIVVIKRSEPGYYPFIVHWTDFSPTRATPLNTEVQVATTQTRCDELVATYRVETSKKGWEKV